MYMLGYMHVIHGVSYALCFIMRDEWVKPTGDMKLPLGKEINRLQARRLQMCLRAKTRGYLTLHPYFNYLCLVITH